MGYFLFNFVAFLQYLKFTGKILCSQDSISYHFFLQLFNMKFAFCFHARGKKRTIECVCHSFFFLFSGKIILKTLDYENLHNNPKTLEMMKQITLNLFFTKKVAHGKRGYEMQKNLVKLSLFITKMTILNHFVSV